MKLPFINIFFILILSKVSAASFGGAVELNEVVMSHDAEFCSVLSNELSSRVDIENSKLNSVSWEAVESDGSSVAPYCSIKEKVVADINNNGVDEVVIRNTGCLSGFPAQEIFVFDNEQLKERFKFSRNGRFYELNLKPPSSIGGLFALEIYIFKYGENTKPLLRIRDRNIDTYPRYGVYDIFAEFDENYDLNHLCYLKWN